jgi:hypothetical protein
MYLWLPGDMSAGCSSTQSHDIILAWLYLVLPLQLTEFFTQHGPVNCVRLRRHSNKMFRGSAFVEFQSTEVAEKVGGQAQQQGQGDAGQACQLCIGSYEDQ